MKQTAEDYLGEKVTEAVINRAGLFSIDSQRQATKDAGRIAGLNVFCALLMSQQPLRSLMAWTKRKTKKIVVFDLGGGTFDVSILELGDGCPSKSRPPTAIPFLAAKISTSGSSII